MYLDFYSLQKAPFHITSDPAFLFLSPSHKAALRALVYGIEARQGFVALVGAVGVGKTTVLRSYLERVEPSQLTCIYIFNPNMSFSHVLQTICRAFGLEVPPEEVVDTVNRLHQALLEEYHRGRNVALIVDEAQHMPIETLEQLRLLSNLETPTQKLIQMVLVGQPEFEAKLHHPALRQLHQRVVIRATITPLTTQESLEYIAHRLAQVRLTDAPLFTKGALRQIIKHAKGTPRVLNILCTNALMQGCGARQPRIAARIAKQVIADYTGKRVRGRWRPWLVWTSATALLAAVCLVSPYPHPAVPRDSVTAQARPEAVSPPAEAAQAVQRRRAAHDLLRQGSEEPPALPMSQADVRPPPATIAPAPATPAPSPARQAVLASEANNALDLVGTPTVPAPLTPRVTPTPSVSTSGSAHTSCDALKAKIRAKLGAKSLTGYTLTIMTRGALHGLQVVGSCEGHTKKIVLTRAPTAP